MVTLGSKFSVNCSHIHLHSARSAFRIMARHWMGDKLTIGFHRSRWEQMMDLGDPNKNGVTPGSHDREHRSRELIRLSHLHVITTNGFISSWLILLNELFSATIFFWKNRLKFLQSEWHLFQDKKVCASAGTKIVAVTVNTNFYSWSLELIHIKWNFPFTPKTPF